MYLCVKWYKMNTCGYEAMDELKHLNMSYYTESVTTEIRHAFTTCLYWQERHAKKNMTLHPVW